MLLRDRRRQEARWTARHRRGDEYVLLRVRLVSGSFEYVSPSFDAKLSQVPEGCVNI